MMQVYPLQNKGLVMMNRITVVVFAFVPLMEAQFASQIRLTLRHILAITKGVKSKLIARWEWHQFFMMF
jgi:hypothetical protein